MTELQTSRTLDVVAAEINALTGTMLATAVEIGRRMLEAKEMLPYGAFGKWIEENTPYSSSKANNYMRLFQGYAADQGSVFAADAVCHTCGKLSYSKALALLALPAEEREIFVEEHDVEAMSTRELQQAIRERDEAIKRAEDLEKTARSGEAELAALRDELAQAEDKLIELEREGLAAQDQLKAARDAEAELKKENAELKRRPVDVAVQVDEAAVEKARKEGLAQGKKDAAAAAKAALARAEKKLAEAEAQVKEVEAARQSAQEQAEGLRKQLEAAGKKAQLGGNADLVEFNVYFKAVQSDLEKMGDVLQRLTEAGQTELANKLRGALLALSVAFKGMAELEEA